MHFSSTLTINFMMADLYMSILLYIIFIKYIIKLTCYNYCEIIHNQQEDDSFESLYL